MERFSLADAIRLLDDDTQYSESFEFSAEDDDISGSVPITDLLGEKENDEPSYQTLFPVAINNDTIDIYSKNTDENNNDETSYQTLFPVAINNDTIDIYSKNTDENNNDESSYQTQFPVFTKNDMIDTNHKNNNVNNNTYIQGTESEETPVSDGDELNESVQEFQKRGRGRTRNEETWKQNVRKRKRQSGKEYESLKGKRFRAREVKTTKDCNGGCKFRCSQTFSNKDRKDIFEQFWNLNDSEKNVFYGNTTDKDLKNSVRSQSEKSRRKFSYKFYFRKGIERVRVCKVFYLSTLDISQRRIEYFYQKSITSPSGDKRGRHVKSKVPNRAIDFIKNHIESFPRVSSHYCRASSSKEYLEKGLSVAKMYEMYTEHCKESGVIPQAIHVYRRVFTLQYNIGFFKPKKDRCDLCEEYEISERADKDVPNILKTKYKLHKDDKIKTKAERDNDRSDTNKLVICFDMQNVMTCPRSNVSNFFYKRKLNVYNLTAHCSADKTCYNVVWNEAVSGRSSNDIASGVVAILDKVVKRFPSKEEIVLWSDSCVPQNKNSIMCYALKKFIDSHPSVKQITQKFGTPGHSSIQEVDNIHSHIEKRLKVSDIYSPLSLIRVLKSVRLNHMEVIQRVETKDYQSAASNMNFKDVPFSKLKCLRISNVDPHHVQYKLSFVEDAFTETSILRKTRSKGLVRELPNVLVLNKVPIISSEKKKDIEDMLKFMPEDDISFMENLLKIGRKRPISE